MLSQNIEEYANLILKRQTDIKWKKKKKDDFQQIDEPKCCIIPVSSREHIVKNVWPSDIFLLTIDWDSNFVQENYKFFNFIFLKERVGH